MNFRRHAADVSLAQTIVQFYRDRKATTAALRLVQSALFDYAPRYGRRYEEAAQTALRRLVSAGVEPVAVLARVVAFYLIVERRPFRMQREEDTALGLWLLKLSPYRRRGIRAESMPQGNAAREVGEVAREALALYAGAVIRRYEADAAERAALVRESADLESPAAP